MSKVLSLLLIAFCALNGWAQAPLLKTVEAPIAATPMLRAEGLLNTHWTQNYPYNQLCPRDPVNGNAYSVAGCPAVAMGQIINYLRTTQDTRFTNDDDYVHYYAGRNYVIDDDGFGQGFMSLYLLSLWHYNKREPDQEYYYTDIRIINAYNYQFSLSSEFSRQFQQVKAISAVHT